MFTARYGLGIYIQSQELSTFYGPLRALRTAGFNIHQLYVLPHTAVFMCFVLISEQIAIISLYNINCLVCITEAEFTARYELDR